MTHQEAFTGLLYNQAMMKPDIFFAMLGNRANGELVLEETWDTAALASGATPLYTLADVERHPFSIGMRPGIYLVFPKTGEATRAVAAILLTPLNMDTMQFEENAQAAFYEIQGEGPFTLMERDEEILTPRGTLTDCIDKNELITLLSSFSAN